MKTTKSKPTSIKATEPDLRLAQLAALQKRLKSGKPLTAAQMQFVDRKPDTAKPSDAWPQVGDIAGSLNELARQLGVDRRVIGWHRGRDGAPRTLSVSQWRGYLLQHGKGATLDRLSDATRSSCRDTRTEVFGDGLLAGHSLAMDDIGSLLAAVLPGDDIAALRDRIGCSLWIISAARVHAVALQHGCQDTPLTPDDDGEQFPEAITAAAKRIGLDLQAELARAGFRS